MGNSGFQPGLFLVVFGKQTGKVLIGYLACGVALIELFHKAVQLFTSPLRLAHFLPVLLDGVLLVLVGRFPHTLDKLRFIVPHIPAHALDCGKNGSFHFCGGDIVHGAVAGKLAVVGTHKSIVQILALHKAAAVGQLRAAVGAVEKPGQAVWGVLPLGGAAFCSHKPLDGVPCFLVHNGGDFPVKNILFLRRSFAGAFSLVVLADGFP